MYKIIVVKQSSGISSFVVISLFVSSVVISCVAIISTIVQLQKSCNHWWLSALNPVVLIRNNAFALHWLSFQQNIFILFLMILLDESSSSVFSYPLNDAAETVNEIGSSVRRAMGGTSGVL